jgi:hypothetical protein
MAWMARLRAPVAAAVEAVPDGATAAGRDRAGAAEGGERGFAAAPAGVGEAHDGLCGANRPDAEPGGQPGGEVLHDGQQLGVVVFQLVPGLAQCERQAGDLGLPDRLLAAGIRGQLPPGQRREGRLAQRPAGGPAVGVAPGQQQGTQPAPFSSSRWPSGPGHSAACAAASCRSP